MSVTFFASSGQEANFSNANARGLLRLLGLGSELVGSCSASDLRRAIIRARSSANARKDLIREGTITRGSAQVANGRIQRGATLIEGSNSDADTLRRLSNLEWVAVNAEGEIHWG